MILNLVFIIFLLNKHLFSSVQSLSCVWLFATPWTAACQASLSITNSQSLLKLMCIKSVMPSNHLILCHPLLFPPSIFPSIRVFSSESVLHIRWPKYWSFIMESIHYVRGKKKSTIFSKYTCKQWTQREQILQYLTDISYDCIFSTCLIKYTSI